MKRAKNKIQIPNNFECANCNDLTRTSRNQFF
ncbi:MAG TPA: hypothetical protein DCO77_14615 [Nitrospiraceae bacterium]|nr:hypothetical protein [Nitrospiraceae bacterium]